MADDAPRPPVFDDPFKDALPSGERNFFTLVEKNVDGMVLVDVNGVVLFANPAAEKLFGRSSANFVGCSFGFPVVASENTVIDILRPDGTLAATELRVAEIDWEGKPAYLVSLHDITQRMRVLDSLKESETRFRSLTSLVPVGVYLTDAKGRCKYVNAKWLEMAGLDSDEALGEGWIKAVHPEDREMVSAGWEKMVQAKGGWGMEYRFRTPDMRTTWVYGAATPVLDEDGGVTAFIGANSDITAFKIMHHELIQAKERAEGSNRAKSEFLANMSHEIRTPLNGVLGILQLLGLSELDDEQREYVETGLAAGRSLLRIINDILDFSKIEAGKLEIENRAFELDAVISTVVAALREQAARRKIRLIQTIDARLPNNLIGDDSRLRQILFNLVGNAIKFTEAGTVRIEVSGQAQEADGAGFTLKFTVSDTGVGIPPDKLAHIFDAFTQADGSLSRRHQGTGLGLAIVKRLVGLMGGQVRMESVLGQGATVTVEVNASVAQCEDTERRAGQTTHSPDPPNSYRLLVVEDDCVNQLCVKSLLQRIGHQVTVCSDGAAALDLVRRNDFDCVLMDIQMPGMDGLEAVRRIRAGEAGQKAGLLPIIALTAHAMKGARERYLEAGMAEYIAKPVEIAELRQVIERVVQDRSNQAPSTESPAEDARA